MIEVELVSLLYFTFPIFTFLIIYIPFPQKMSTKRKFESGASKRKKIKLGEETMKKNIKINAFFPFSSSSTQSTTICATKEVIVGEENATILVENTSEYLTSQITMKNVEL